LRGEANHSVNGGEVATVRTPKGPTINFRTKDGG